MITDTLGYYDNNGNNELGFVLPHEHVFVDLRTWDTPGYVQVEVEDIIHLMAPEIEKEYLRE